MCFRNAMAVTLFSHNSLPSQLMKALGDNFYLGDLSRLSHME